MKEKSALEKIDYMLRHIKEVNPKLENLIIDHGMKTFGMTRPDVQTLLEKLARDGNITCNDYGNIKISFDGVLLLESGGYTKEARRKSKDSVFLRRINLWVAIGAGASILFGAFEIYDILTPYPDLIEQQGNIIRVLFDI